MVSFSKKIEISATPAIIWSVMEEMERWNEWTATIVSIKKLNGIGFAPGAKLLIEQPQLPKAIWQISEMEWQKSFSMKKGNTFFKVVAGHVLEPGRNGTLVSLSISFSGFIASWVAKKYGSMMEGYLATEAAGLKNVCELKYRNDHSIRVSGN